jgi:hypothetical protein
LKKLILLVAVVCIAFQVEAQSVKQKNVPDVVISTMNTLYPDVSKVKWFINDGMYVATFKQDEIKTEAVFSGNGAFSSTDTEITLSLLPAKIQSYLANEFPTMLFDKVAYEMQTDARGIITYEVEVDGTEYFFSTHGNLITQISNSDNH